MLNSFNYKNKQGNYFLIQLPFTVGTILAEVISNRAKEYCSLASRSKLLNQRATQTQQFRLGCLCRKAGGY